MQAKKYLNPQWLAAFIAIVLGLAAFSKFRILDGPDFKVFYVAGKFAISTPEKMYQESPDRFLYPPTSSLLFVPFSLIPSWEYARLAWYLFSLGLIYWFASGSLPACLALIVLARYFVINLRYGQVNLLVLALLFAVTVSLQQRRSSAAGALLALNSMLKVFPGVQIVEFFVRRDWRAFAWFSGAFAVLLALPFLVWPWPTAISLYQEFPAELAKKGIPSFTHNQSVLALLNRLFLWEKFYAFPVDDLRWRIVTLPDWLLKIFALAIGGSISALAWLRAKRRKEALDGVAATGFSILFLSHIVWKPYFVFLFPALIQCLNGKGKTHWVLFLAFLVLGPLLSADIYGFYYSTWMEGACTHLWAALFLFIAWYYLPSCRKSDHPHRPGPAGYTSGRLTHDPN